MHDQSFDDSLKAYYESLQTPILFFKNEKIQWHNSAAEYLYQSRSFCMYFLTCNIPQKDQAIKVELSDQTYNVMLRPWAQGMVIEVLDIPVLSTMCADQFTVNSAISINHLVRNNTHKVFHAVDGLRPILESKEKYEELSYLDIVFEGTYQVLRASDVYKEYIDLFHSPSTLSKVDIMQELEVIFSAARVILQHSTTPFHWIFSQPQLNCRIDVHRLSFAVLHLIANAFYFSAPGNDVKVEVSALKGDWLKISVYDKGVGFSPDGVQQALQPFYSYDPNSGDVVGCGLGLTYAYAYARQAGGLCEVSSFDDKTVVTLTVPFDPISTKAFSSSKTQLSLGKFSQPAIVLSNVAHISWT